MGEINGDGERSGPGSMARVRVMFSVRWMGNIRLYFELRSSSDVSLVVRIIFRFMVRWV